MKLKRVVYSKKMLKEDTAVSTSYVTSVQNNKFQEVTITPSECRKSVRAFSRMKKNTKV